jgi:AcrR family transcriptional regulator
MKAQWLGGGRALLGPVFAAKGKRPRDQLGLDDKTCERALGVLADLLSVEEPLSRAIGTTKASLYWHFGTRDDLLRAALDRWLRVATEDVITAIEALSDDPVDKARALLSLVTAHSAQHPGQLRLYAAADPHCPRACNAPPSRLHRLLAAGGRGFAGGRGSPGHSRLRRLPGARADRARHT